MNYLLDTNIVLIYLRDERTREYIEKEYNPFGTENNPVISVVTAGEIKSIARRNYWGNKRLKLLVSILDSLIIADINSQDVIDMYAEIDAFSQGRIKEKPLGQTSRNMGKNDIWIAATATVTNSRLITMDQDFNHLDGEYLKLILIERYQAKK